MKNRSIETQSSIPSSKRAKLSNGEPSFHPDSQIIDEDKNTQDDKNTKAVELQHNDNDYNSVTTTMEKFPATESYGFQSHINNNNTNSHLSHNNTTVSSTSISFFSPVSNKEGTPILSSSVGLVFPQVYCDNSPDYFQADDQWMTHTSWEWMYCLADESYFHVKSNVFYIYNLETNQFQKIATDETATVTTEQSRNDQTYEPTENDDDAENELGESEEEEKEEEEEEEEFFLLDFEKDIEASTSEIMTDFKGRSEREDRHVTKELLPLDLVSDTQACCFFTAIFDGHGGSTCAEYCVKHLITNLVTTYRQTKEAIAKKLRKQTTSLGREATTQDIGLSYSSEVEALKRALQKSFEITNQNYLSLAERKGYTDGCTALVVLVYGPDEDGTLKILTAHAGDCRAVMCRDHGAIRLTEDHKPDRKEERSRIESSGGNVVYLKDVWRVTATVGKKIFGLSTARSIGDIHMKRPKEFVTALPDLRIVTIDFNRDQFIILGSDGIWDVITDQDACDLVNSHVRASDSSQEAANALTKLAKKRGSSDDKTATVILFSWHSQVAIPEPALEDEPALGDGLVL